MNPISTSYPSSTRLPCLQTSIVLFPKNEIKNSPSPKCALCFTHPLKSSQSIQKFKPALLSHGFQYHGTNRAGHHVNVFHGFVWMSNLVANEHPPAEKRSQFVSCKYFPFTSSKIDQKEYSFRNEVVKKCLEQPKVKYQNKWLDRK